MNTNKILRDARRHGYAVPAFNFYNMESLQAIIAAADATKSPVILAVSESALIYMTDDFAKSLSSFVSFHSSLRNASALHLDHGHTLESCRHAIELGFGSVMIDGSALPFDENAAITRNVVELAHAHGVSVEGELGALGGIEDENTLAENSRLTKPDDAARFAQITGVDSLAVSIGTSHGAYKMHMGDELRFDILEAIAAMLPNLPLVLHGASSIPQNLIETINQFGGKISGAGGIPADQLRRAIELGICKINVDSDGRLAWMAAARKTLARNPESFDPRKALAAARDAMTELYISEIENIMGSSGKSASQILEKREEIKEKN